MLLNEHKYLQSLIVTYMQVEGYNPVLNSYADYLETLGISYFNSEPTVENKISIISELAKVKKLMVYHDILGVKRQLSILENIPVGECYHLMSMKAFYCDLIGGTCTGDTMRNPTKIPMFEKHFEKYAKEYDREFNSTIKLSDLIYMEEEKFFKFLNVIFTHEIKEDFDARLLGIYHSLFKQVHELMVALSNGTPENSGVMRYVRKGTHFNIDNEEVMGRLVDGRLRNAFQLPLHSNMPSRIKHIMDFIVNTELVKKHVVHVDSSSQTLEQKKISSNPLD